MKAYTYGIDFGTSNSALTIFDVETANICEEKIIKSLIYFDPSPLVAPIVGVEAEERYVYGEMKGRLFRSIKTFLKDPYFTHTTVFGQNYDLETLVSIILKTLKSVGDAIAGQDVRRVVLGRPVYFSTEPEWDALAQNRLEHAARMAGFEEIHFQLEPIAAALAYERTLAKPQMVLVADLGGGTTDYTVMRLNPAKCKSHDRRGDILATGGVYIGGDNFDRELAWGKVVTYFGKDAKYESWGKWLALPPNLFNKLCMWDQVHQLKDPRDQEFLRQCMHRSDNKEALERFRYLVNNNLGYALSHAVEGAKIELTNYPQGMVWLERGPIHLNAVVGQQEFENYNAPNIRGIEEGLDQTLAKSSIKPEAIDLVFMTGGTSLIPSVKKCFCAKFGAQKVTTGNTFTSVAEGLGLSSQLFF